MLLVILGMLVQFCIAAEMCSPQAESEIQALISQMTLKEKVSLLHGDSKFEAGGIERLGIPRLYLSDGPHAVREENAKHRWAPIGWKNDYTTYLPTGVMLASTWSRDLGWVFGETLGAEARHRNKDIILAPGINIVRTPLNGRNFEYYGEDPYHIAEMVREEIRAIQAQDVAACVKHYLLNNQENSRSRVDVDVSDRALYEIYLPGFIAAIVEAKSYSVMGAYNKYRGYWLCENKRLVGEILKKDMDFQGVYLTDWNAAHSTVLSAEAGLDLEMGTNVKSYDDYYFANPLIKAVKEGKVSESLVDDKVARRLRLMYAIKAIGKDKANRKKGQRNTRKHQMNALKIAQEGIVLLKNTRNALPLDLNTAPNILVVGENANVEHARGGGSSKAKALYEITPLQGLKNRCGKMANITYFEGFDDEETMLDIPDECLKSMDPGAGIPAWKVEFYNNTDYQGKPVVTQYRKKIDMHWPASPVKGIKSDFFGVKVYGKISPAVDGNYELCVASDEGAKLYLDDKLLADNWKAYAYRVISKSVFLKAGKTYDIRIEYMDGLSQAQFKFGWLPESVKQGQQKQLADIANNADIVLVFAGLNHTYDCEGRDRKNLELPAQQNALIEQLAAMNPRTVVLLTAGSAVEMPWKDKVAAIVMHWYAGMEGGHAIADIILGHVSPSGKLPITFPLKGADSPEQALDATGSDKVTYKEDIFVGYRWYDHKKLDVLFPFGHGLSYTTFEYSSAKVDRTGSGRFTVSATITNTGNRDGAEVVQLYLSDVESSLPRPVKELKGFEKIFLKAGESKIIKFSIDKKALSFYNPDVKQWVAEAGLFKALIGSSSRDIRQTVQFDYKP